MTAIYWPDFATRRHSPEGSFLQHIGLIFRLFALNEGIPASYGFIFGMRKLEWLSYNRKVA